MKYIESTVKEFKDELKNVLTTLLDEETQNSSERCTKWRWETLWREFEQRQSWPRWIQPRPPNIWEHTEAACQAEIHNSEINTDFKAALDPYRKNKNFKATNNDKVFIEDLGINADMTSKLLYDLSKQSSIIKQLVNDSAKVKTFQLYKFGFP